MCQFINLIHLKLITSIFKFTYIFLPKRSFKVIIVLEKHCIDMKKGALEISILINYCINNDVLNEYWNMKKMKWHSKYETKTKWVSESFNHSFNSFVQMPDSFRNKVSDWIINGACHIWQGNISVIRHFQIPLFFRRATPPAVFVTEPWMRCQNVRPNREWCAMTFISDRGYDVRPRGEIAAKKNA